MTEKRKRGRPRKPVPPLLDKSLLATPYEPPTARELNKARILEQLRHFLPQVRASDEHLADWYQALADAIEAEDALLVARNALGALGHVNKGVILPLRQDAAIGHTARAIRRSGGKASGKSRREKTVERDRRIRSKYKTMVAAGHPNPEVLLGREFKLGRKTIAKIANKKLEVN